MTSPEQAPERTTPPLVLDIDDTDPVPLEAAPDPGDPPGTGDDPTHDDGDVLDGVTLEED